MDASDRYAPYIAAWRERLQEQRERDKRRMQEARQYAVACARLLRREFGAKSVYLFGSLAEGRFHAHSDIDLAVGGLEPRLYFKALAKLHRVADGFAIDLVPLEEHTSRETILKKGEQLDDLPSADPPQSKHREGTKGSTYPEPGKG